MQSNGLGRRQVVDNFQRCRREATLASRRHPDQLDAILLICAEGPTDGIYVVVLLDAARHRNEFRVDVLARAILVLRLADGLVERMREVLRLEEFDNDAVPVDGRDALGVLGGGRATVERDVGVEQPMFAQVHPRSDFRRRRQGELSARAVSSRRLCGSLVVVDAHLDTFVERFRPGT